MLVAAFVSWLNGPGLRWLAPKVAAHFMEPAGLRGSLAVEGSFTGGFSVCDVRIEGAGPLLSLRAARVTPVYQIRRLLAGEVGGLAVRDLHAELDLDARPQDLEPDEKDAQQSIDIAALAETLRGAREVALPLDLSVTNLSLALRRNGGRFLALAPSSLDHRPGAPEFRLALGEVTDATGRVWSAQKSVLTWRPDGLALDRIDPLPGIGIRDLQVRLPAGDEPSAETSLRIDDAVFFLETSAGFRSVNLDLREGSLRASAVAGRFGLKLPADATLTSLAVNADGLLPDPLAANGGVRLLLEDITAQGWEVPELGIDLGLDEARATLAASGRALGSGFSLNAEVPVTRADGRLAPGGDAAGSFEVADVPSVVAALAEKVKAIDPAKPLLPSVLAGTFRAGWNEGKPQSASCEARLTPADPTQAAALAVTAGWQPDRPLAVELATEGVKAEAFHDFEKQSYEGDVRFDGFRSGRIARWLETFRIIPGLNATLTGSWKGGGELTAGSHRGSLDLTGIEVIRPEMPAVKAIGGIDYQWPEVVVTRGLRVEAAGQSVAADLKLAGKRLDLTGLRWSDRGRELLAGSARLPVPEDFAKWRELLKDGERPIELAIISEVLPLTALKDWLPAAAKLDAGSTGKLEIKAAGTFAKPEIRTRIELRGLRSPEQPKLPPADLTLDLTAKDDRLSVSGDALAPDFAPAVLSASMPFRPGPWAEDPESIRNEPVSARVDLPRVDVSRFASLVAAARSVQGVVTGNIAVAGTIAKPEVKGRLDLAGGGLELKDPALPPVTGIAVAVEADTRRVTLRELKAAVAGGTLQGTGFLDLRDGGPGAMDFRLTGRHLPVKRDESLILRTHLDLRLAGPWATAALTGTVGVVDSLFYRDIELLPIGSPFTTPSAASLPKLDAPAARPADAVPEPFRNWTLDVRARTANPFLIRGNFATGRIDVDLRVGGTFGRPSPDGEVRISSLRAALPFSTLNVKSGVVRFDPAGGFDPLLEIRGTAEPRPYRVNAYVYGRASNPQLVLTSSPPLPENEIMTLLATGTTTSGLEDPAAASSRAMQLLAEELRRGRFAVGKQLRPLLGLADRVDFTLNEADPYTSEKFSTATLQITDRWYLSAGMGAEGDTRVLGIWRLTFR